MQRLDNLGSRARGGTLWSSLTFLSLELGRRGGAQRGQHDVEHNLEGHNPQPRDTPPHEVAVLRALRNRNCVVESRRRRFWLADCTQHSAATDVDAGTNQPVAPVLQPGGGARLQGPPHPAAHQSITVSLCFPALRACHGMRIRAIYDGPLDQLPGTEPWMRRE